MSVETVTDFLRNAKKVLKRVDREDVVLSRRGKAPIRISLETRSAAAASSLVVAADVLAALMAIEVPAHLADALTQRFPWVRFLPKPERERFAREFVETLQACASIGKTARLDELVAAWRSTAEIYADPVLAEDLKRPLKGTGKPVARP